MIGEAEEKWVEQYLKDEILRILATSLRNTIYSAEELRKELPDFTLEQIREAMWSLHKEGKVKMFIRLAV